MKKEKLQVVPTPVPEESSSSTDQLKNDRPLNYQEKTSIPVKLPGHGGCVGYVLTSSRRSDHRLCLRLAEGVDMVELSNVCKLAAYSNLASLDDAKLVCAAKQGEAERSKSTLKIGKEVASALWKIRELRKMAAKINSRKSN
eukprot:IDg6164t1